MLEKLIRPFGSGRKYTDISLLFLRLTLGYTMIFGHGLGKFQKLISDEPIEFVNFLSLGHEITFGLVVFAEFFCSIFLVVGAFTRLATLPLLFTMFVAFVTVHLDASVSEQEKVLMYFVGYFILFLKGSGKYSLDKLLLDKF